MHDRYENVLLVVDYEKICRLCLHSTGVMADIFENNSETCLKELILCAAGLEVQQDDGLPTRICHKCLYIVELSCELRTMAARTHTLLTVAAGNDYVAEYLKECDLNIGSKHTIKNEHCSFQKENNSISQELRLVVEDDGEISLMKHEDGKPSGTRAKQKSGKTNASTERTRRAAPKHLTCQICLSSFPNKEQVHEHIKTHYVDSNLTSYLELQRPYECEACRDGAITKKQLVVHHRRHLAVNPFVCKQQGCDFVGKNQDSLRHHMVVHGARSQVCEQCGASYRRRWELRQHRERAHAAAPRECRACRPPRTMRNALTYRAHIATHRREPRHLCGWRGCPKAYHSAGALAAHRRAHKGLREFACPLCAVAAYTSQSLLNRHLRMHDRARVPKCDKCAATFAEYGAFYRHRITAHGPWQPHRCAGCSRGYQSESKLAKHVRQCELAASMRAYGEQGVAEADLPDNEVTDDLLAQFKGQSLLVQPGSVNELSTENLVLQELPPHGLLFVEVDPDTEVETAADHLWRQV